MSARHGRRAQPASPEKRIISGDDLAKMTERLTRVPKPAKAGDDHLLAKKIVISEEDLSKQVQRLYDLAIETKARKIEKAAKAADQQHSTPSRKLNEEELAESVARQYTQALYSKKVNEEKLKKKFLFQPAEAQVGAHGQKLTPRTKKDIAAMGVRLHDECMQKKAESKEKLYEKYVYATGPKKTVISTAEAQEAADRLSCRTEGGAVVTPRRRDK
jgi:hypothetical protein